MPSTYSLRQRFRYWFENTLSRGSGSIIAWLGLASLALVLLAGLILTLSGISAPDSGPLSFGEAAWQSLMRALDSGAVGGDEGWALRLVMLLVTIGGLFILSTFIGTLTSGLEGQLEELRKGRSRVLEKDHTLILGWSPKVFTIVEELVMANASRQHARIVILSERDKVDMEDELRARIPDTRTTKIICRTGSPLDLDELEVVSPHDARSIIVLSPEGLDNPDTHVIKSVLALTNNPNRKPGTYHIVAELQSAANLEAGQLVGNNETTFVLADELIARVTAQTCRQSGLSEVYTELLDFGGKEIYFREEPTLLRQTYHEACLAYDNSTVIGIFRADGTARLNPPASTLIKNGDKLILIAEDDTTIRLAPKHHFDIHTNVFQKGETAAKPERTLILGWNPKGFRIIQELDQYVAPGSEATVVLEDDAAWRLQLDSLSARLTNQALTVRVGEITQKATLYGLQPETYDHAVVLSESHLPLQQADARTLITLLHLRNISDQTRQDLSIVSEMLDVRNKALAEVTRADDFIVSDKLVSLMLAQLSENGHLQQVFDDLFSAEGSEIYLKPIEEYIQPGVAVNFFTLTEAASRRNETAIGYKKRGSGPGGKPVSEVEISPVKHTEVLFSAGDKLIVLSEN